MGWGDCGTDSEGRPIGYVFEAVCDEPGCDAKIDRGLSYACGDMHGATEAGCEEYFCEQHRQNYVDVGSGRYEMVCNACAKALIESGDWYENEDGEIVRTEAQRCRPEFEPESALHGAGPGSL